MPVGGLVPHDGSTVDQLPPIVGPDPLGFPGSPPFIGAADYTLVFDASGLAGQDLLLKDNPRLILEYSVQLEESGVPTNAQRFRITAAEYDGTLDRLVTFLDPAGPGLSSFVVGGSIDASLVPHFLRVVNNGILDSYAADTSIRLVFDATKIDPLTGGPDEVNSHGFTEDVSLLNIDDPKGSFSILVSFQDARGLKAGADVRYKGVRVGSVRSVTVTENGSGAQVVTSINPER